MGRTLDNATSTLSPPFTAFTHPTTHGFSTWDWNSNTKMGIKNLGFSMEDIPKQERDAELGNGGLGRLAACYLDSGASQELPLLFILFRFASRHGREYR